MVKVKIGFEKGFVYHIFIEIHPLIKNHVEMSEENWKELSSILKSTEDENESVKDSLVESGEIHKIFDDFFEKSKEFGVLDEVIKRSPRHLAIS